VALFNWFKKNKKDHPIKVEERKQTVLQDSAAAAAFAEAGEHTTARAMIDKTKGNRKILVIGKEDRFSEILVNYSFDMAKRLDFELVMLNSTNAPLSLPDDRREEATTLFENQSKQNFSTLQERAEQAGVPIDHLVEIGQLDDVVHKLQTQLPGMRYVLTEPDPELAQKAKGSVSIPVFDLGSYHSAAA
jgi:ribonucleotide monophosphatase NagD (HAD superfamily)